MMSEDESMISSRVGASNLYILRASRRDKKLNRLTNPHLTSNGKYTRKGNDSSNPYSSNNEQEDTFQRSFEEALDDNSISREDSELLYN
jgi:hypothetical protein